MDEVELKCKCSVDGFTVGKVATELGCLSGRLLVTLTALEKNFKYLEEIKSDIQALKRVLKGEK